MSLSLLPQAPHHHCANASRAGQQGWAFHTVDLRSPAALCYLRAYSLETILYREVVNEPLAQARSRWVCLKSRLGAGSWRPSSECACAAVSIGDSGLSLCRCSGQLTWRDVQHLLVKTSRPAHLKANDWKTNGAGHKGVELPVRWARAHCPVLVGPLGDLLELLGGVTWILRKNPR